MTIFNFLIVGGKSPSKIRVSLNFSHHFLYFCLRCEEVGDFTVFVIGLLVGLIA